MTIRFELLGRKMRDTASGIEGIVVSLCQHYSGTVQYAIQPKGDGKTLPDAFNFDELILEEVDEGISAKVPTPFPTQPLHSIGDEVIDKLSGFPCKISDITYHINGCITVKAVGKWNGASKDDVLNMHADQSRFLSVRKAETPAAAPTNRGGPSGKADRY